MPTGFVLKKVDLIWLYLVCKKKLLHFRYNLESIVVGKKES